MLYKLVIDTSYTLIYIYLLKTVVGVILSRSMGNNATGMVIDGKRIDNKNANII